MIVCKFYEDTKMAHNIEPIISTAPINTDPYRALQSYNIFNIFKARIYLNLIMAFETG